MTHGLARLTPRRQWGGYVHGIVVNGQSLSTGGFGNPSLSTSQPYKNIQLSDSSLTYDITNPAASTLSTVPLVCPIRGNVSIDGGTSGLEYPHNITGETAEVALANNLTHLLGWQFATSGCGQGGAAYGQICRGGTGNSYAASLYEVQALKNLHPNYRALFTMLKHGEADDTDPLSQYFSAILQLQRNYQWDINPLCQRSPVEVLPMLLFQQQAGPTTGTTVSSGIAQWMAVLNGAASGRIVGVAPNYGYYQYGTPDRLHLAAAGYRLQGEKAAEAAFNFLARTYPELGLTPLWSSTMPFVALSAVRSGNTITVTFNVPVGPITTDSSVTAPHGTGTTYGNGGSTFPSSSGWTGGLGGELWHGGVGGTPIALSGAPVISGNTIAWTGVSQPDTWAYAVSPDTTTVGPAGSGGFPDGRCGTLIDSDTWAGLTGTHQANRLWTASITTG